MTCSPLLVYRAREEVDEVAKIRVSWRFPDGTDVDAVMTRVMTRMGTHARSLIVRRTGQGRGIDGLLAPYSAGYRLAKAAAGRSPALVDLTLSGQMLQALTVLRVTPRLATLGFRPLRRRKVTLAARGRKFVVSDLETRRSSRRRVVAKAKATTSAAAVVKNDELARIHHEGLGRMPARPWFGLSDRERREILEIGRRESQTAMAAKGPAGGW